MEETKKRGSDTEQDSLFFFAFTYHTIYVAIDADWRFDVCGPFIRKGPLCAFTDDVLLYVLTVDERKGA